MIKIAASILGTALTVGGMGYTYVTEKDAEIKALKTQNSELVTESERQKRAIIQAVKTLTEAEHE